MAILAATDQPTYFPRITQGGAALEGLIALAQSLCESAIYGAGRPLDAQQHTHIISINQSGWGYLPITPVISIQSVSVRVAAGSFGRTVPQWIALSPEQYSLDSDGRLWVGGASEAQVTYTAGFDFESNSKSSDVQGIKALAGQIVEFYGLYRVGLDSYLNNPSGDTGMESYNLMNPQTFLYMTLQPLKKYMPRSFGG